MVGLQWKWSKSRRVNDHVTSRDNQRSIVLPVRISLASSVHHAFHWPSRWPRFLSCACCCEGVEVLWKWKITVSNQHRFEIWTELFLASCRKSTTMLHGGFRLGLTLLSVSHMLCMRIFMESKFSRCIHPKTADIGFQGNRWGIWNISKNSQSCSHIWDCSSRVCRRARLSRPVYLEGEWLYALPLALTNIFHM
jgi:hypothetical protein